MMKKIVFSFLLIGASFASSLGQSNEATDTVKIRNTIMITPQLPEIINLVYFHPYDYFTPYNKAIVELYAKGSSNSNGIPSSFSNAFVNPKFIDNELKSKAYDRLNGMGRFGLELDFGVEAVVSPDSTWYQSQQALTFSAGRQLVYGAEFSEDLLRTVFSGNAAYADQTANFDNSKLYAIGYQYFKIGYRKQLSKDRFGFFTNFGFARGLNHTDIQLNSGSLYTEPSGQWLDLAWNGSYFTSTRSSNRLGESPSNGYLMDLGFYKFLDQKYQWKLSASVKDLGFITWNAQSDNFKRDTSFRFTGLQFYDVLNYDDTTLVVGDSLLNRLRGAEEKASEMKLLPFQLQAELRYLADPKTGRLLLTAGARYRRIPGMRVEYSLRGNYRLINTKPLYLNLGFTYGGFGNLNSNVGLEYKPNRHRIQIGTMYNEGFLSSKSLSGNGIYFSYMILL
jgi:hypothetical protein